MGQVVGKLVNANPGFKVTELFSFLVFKCSFYCLYHVCFFKCSLRFCSKSKTKDRQCKQKNWPKRFKTEIKILSNPGFAWSGLGQPGPGWQYNRLV